MRKGLGLAAVGAIVVFVMVGSAGALASGSARIASACLNKRLSAFGPQVTFRLVLHGKVSCNTARRTRRAYERALLAGRCRSRICGVVFAGGWTCSSTSAVEERQDGGLAGGCERTGASFKVYTVSSRATPSNPDGFQVRLAGGFFLCSIMGSAAGGEGLAAGGGAFCLSHGSPPAESNWHAANVQPNGQVTSCSEEASMMRADCYSGQGDDLGLPYLSPGQQTDVAPFICKVLATGVECTVAATGKGFLITPETVMVLGG